MGKRPVLWLTTRLGVVVVLLATVLLTGLAFAFSPAQPEAGPADGLPAGAQSTRVTELLDRFASGRSDSAVVVVSSELMELIGVCHRIVVMRAGAQQATLDAADASEEILIAHATGTH